MVAGLSGCHFAISAPAYTVSMLVGSALGGFCRSAAGAIERRRPRLRDGTVVSLHCRDAGSGDVVQEMESLARDVLSGRMPPNDGRIPTLLSVDGELYQQQLRDRLLQLDPSRTLIPAVTDAPALASSPMVFMTTPALARGLERLADPFTALTSATTHRQLDPGAPEQPVRFVQTAPTRSNSGLQTLVAQFVAVSGVRPEQFTLAQVEANAGKVAAIHRHITRYGSSTNQLAQAMVRNGPYWASIGSVYESSVINANLGRAPGEEAWVAVYPRATFTSTMRAILPTAPWIDAKEKEAAGVIIQELLTPEIQRLAAEKGLRPANPAVPASLVTRANGVDPRARFDSLRSPRPQVVEAMLRSWVAVAKKPSRVALVVDSSGSMQGNKLPAVQASLSRYLNQLTPRDSVALFDFDSTLRPPVVVDGQPGSRARGQAFIASLQADGGTRLYDAVLQARDWLRLHRRPGEIDAVVVLTDGMDQGSRTSLQALQAELRRSGFSGDERIGVFTVGFGANGDFDASVLKGIATSNGGDFAQGTPDSIRKLMDDLQLSF